MKVVRQRLEEYLDITYKIRELSSPLVRRVDNASDYQRILIENFREIGRLSNYNDEILQDCLLPMLEEEHDLTAEEREGLRDFSKSLLNAENMENLHVLLRYKIVRKLLSDAEKNNDVNEIIHCLDEFIETAFVLMYISERLAPEDARVYRYRDIGLEAAHRLLSYLDEDAFRALPNEECRNIVLVNARYLSAFFERSDHYCDEVNREDYDLMKNALALMEKPVYREEAPNYNWKYHEFRTLQYITNFTEMCNIRGFREEELLEIRDYTARLKELWESDKEYFSEYCTQEMIDLYVHRVSYLCKETDIDEYKAALMEIMTHHAPKQFTLHENAARLVVLAEYLRLVDEENITETDKMRLAYLYRATVSYVHHVPKSGSFSFLLSFLSTVIKEYVELDDRPGEFEDYCLELIAAIHPPTYVHSLGVADIAKVMTRNLIEHEPERFMGFRGCKTIQDVVKKKSEIAEFAYRAARCHDIGKLFVAEMIVMYERKPLEEEFSFVRVHPSIGAYILGSHSHTKEYANTARYHHLWYDGSDGYPREDISKIEEKVIIDIVRIADCMDAATDTIGRSYNRGITFDEILGELNDGRDTSYAGYLVDLLNRPKVKEEIRSSIERNREANYYRIYDILTKGEHK